ncbi:hypothetical protein L0222_28030 [bacterium]|nr:hypothetical protein [bacterium]MCI0602908.1 hypothetical protein [bacterium]
MEKQPRIARARLFTVVAVIAWFSAAFICGAFGKVNEPGRPPLVVGAFITLPILGFSVAYLVSNAFRAFTESLSLTLIVSSHLWRFVGLGFIIAWLKGALPGGFAIPEGLGDIIAALGALLLLPKLRKSTVSHGWLLVWNSFGFIDLVSAIVMGILYSNSAFGILSRGTVTTELMVTFPVSLIPTFFVPLFILLHALTFKKIANLKARA